MQHTVAKRFIYCKHNITIRSTQAILQKVVTFFENLKSWSHTSLFVWDWIAGENRIASDFTRFYRIAKRVTRRIWLADLSGVVFVAGLGSLLTMGLPQKKRQSDCSVVVVCKSDSGGVRTHDPQLRRLLLYPTELRNQHYLHAKTKNNHRQNCIGQAFAMQM